MKSTLVTLDQIVGVIVLYNTRLQDSETFISIKRSLKFSSSTMDIIIYDNSTIAAFRNESIFLLDNVNIHYFHDPSNPGVGKAYNASAHYSEMKLSGKKWILLLDQDTSFPTNAICKYVDHVNQYPDQVMFVPLLYTKAGVYSPCKYFFKRGVVWRDVKAGLHSIKYKTVLNSGCLIKLEAYLHLGGYDERIKLYFSDFNFVDRYRSRYKQFVITDIVCRHDLSDLGDLSLSATVPRFTRYCKDSHNSSDDSLDLLLLFITVMLRAVKLSFKYKEVIFIKIVFKTYINK